MAITATEIRTLALLVAGYASEVQNHSSYQLKWAMTYERDGSPKNNSGYSVGTLQSDLGQRNYLADDLVASYFEWAGSDPARLMGRTEEELSRVLKQQGKPFREKLPDGKYVQNAGLVGNADSNDLSLRPLNSEELAKFNAYLQTSDGKQAVWAADKLQIDKLVAFAQRVQTTQTYQSLGEDDRRNVMTVAMKLFNQSEAYGLTLLGHMNKSSMSWGAVSDEINKRPDYIQSGFRHTVEGLNLYTKILRTDTPLAS